jgi:3-hydroxyacyl-CoA dehydrogenase
MDEADETPGGPTDAASGPVAGGDTEPREHARASVTVTRDSEIALVQLEAPPLNALGQDLCDGLVAALGAAADDPGVRAVLLRGGPTVFATGPESAPFGGRGLAAESDAAVLAAADAAARACRVLEASPKPVVALLQGLAAGAGFELALAAHWRLAAPDARAALPDLRIGLPPGAGATQRLPRLCGAAAALDLVLAGHARAAPELAAAGIVDELLDADSEGMAAAAVAWVRQRLAEDPAPRLAGTRRHQGLFDAPAIAAARTREAQRPEEVRLRAVDCIEAAGLLPFEAGLAFERDAFEACCTSGQGRALRALAVAERSAAHPEALHGVVPRAIADCAVYGADERGTGIAVALLNAGLRVHFAAPDIDALEAGVARVTGLFDRAVSRGKLATEIRAARLARLDPVAGPEDFGSAGLIVVSADAGDIAGQEALFAKLGEIARPGTLLATASPLPLVERLARAAGRPADVLGLNFLAPAPAHRLVEVVAGTGTGRVALASAMALARRMGKQPVLAGPGAGAGFVAGAVFAACLREADALVAAGASPYAVDAALRDYGFARGPFQELDLAEPDGALAASLFGAAGGAVAASVAPDGFLARLMAAGRRGHRDGAGVYAYDAASGRRGREDPEVLALAAAARAGVGTARRPPEAAEIQRSCLLAMANAGAWLVARGIAATAGCVDVAAVHGHGFPRWRGGPMQAAEAAGLLGILRDLRARAGADGAPPAQGLDTDREPAPGWAELVREGRGVAALRPAAPPPRGAMAPGDGTAS